MGISFSKQTGSILLFFKSKADLHERGVKFIWEKYERVLLIPGLGEN